MISLELGPFRVAKTAFWVLVVLIPVLGAEVYALHTIQRETYAPSANPGPAIAAALAVTGSLVLFAAIALIQLLAARWAYHRSSDVRLWHNTNWDTLHDGRHGTTYLGPKHLLSGFMPGWGHRRNRIGSHFTM